MKTKILIIEDNKSDIDFIRYELDKSGINYESRIAQNEAGLRKTLEEFIPDVILSDYSLPSFDGLRAFKITEEVIPGTPFIVVSGTIGEERAVELIKSGVTDYAIKDRLYTLAPKIHRALKEAEEKKEKKITDEKLYKVNRLYNFVSQVNQNIVRVKDEASLFRNACEMAIAFGKFKIAWMGFFDLEEKTISIVEQCGIAAENLHLFNKSNYDNDGPESVVLSTGLYFICNDIRNDLQLVSWREFALALGINSCMILPLRKAGNIVGTFNLYSTELNFSGKDEINLLVEVANDISFALNVFENEKRQIDTDKKLSRGEALFRSLIEKSVDMKMLTNIDGHFIYGSPSVTRTFGYSLQEILEKSAFTFFHPDDLSDLFKNRAIILNDPGASFPFRYRFKHKDGRWIWCEGTLTNMLYEPEIQAFVSNFRDISEKKIAEEHLEFDKNNLNALINNTKDLMWSVDRDYKLITSNIPFDDAGLVNFGASIEKGGDVLNASYSPDMYNHFKLLYERAFAGESFMEPEHFYYPVESWMEISYYPIRQGEEIIGTACYSRDVTHIKLAEAEREKMVSNIIQHSANLEQFATIVSHNLRAPVVNIKGLCNVLQQDISGEDRHRSEQFLVKASEQLDDVLKDLNKILEVRSEINEYKETVYFNELVDAIRSSIHIVIEKENVKIETDFRAIDRIKSIKSYLYSIFYNLISNSIKYRQPGKTPHIKIYSESDSEKIKISFKDNGVGINIEKHGDKIFGLYKRFHSSTEGKGLGLFMVKTQVETLGGTIRVESKPGEGAEFIIEMPL